MAEYAFDQILELLERAQRDGVPLQPIADYAETQIRAREPKSMQAQATKSPFENYTPGIGPLGDSLILTLAMQIDKEVPAWSIYPYRRDMVLRRLWKQEPTMAGAIYSMTSRIQALEYMVNREYGSSKRLQKVYESLLTNSQFGRGFYELRQKVILDILTQDNGAFIELVGAGNPLGPMVGLPTQINHIDSHLCWRTFDPNYPVLYVNPYDNSYHRIHKTRIAFTSSMTQPDELARGIGFCGVSRALRNVQYLRDVGIYKHEKVSGRFNRAIGWGSGITDKQFDNALSGAESERKGRGFVMYKNIPFILTARENVKLDMLDLAKLPDGFDFEKEMNLLVYAYAMAFGVDAREFWPSTMAGATKADASIQHLKARGKGYADIIAQLKSMFNIMIFKPESGITLDFDQTDDEADLLSARIHGQVISNLERLVKMAAIDNEEARDIAIDKGLINRELLKKEPDLKPMAQTPQAPVKSDIQPDIQDHGGPRETLNPERQNEEKSLPDKIVSVKHEHEHDHAGGAVSLKQDTETETVQPTVEDMPEFTPDELDNIYELYKNIMSGKWRHG